MFTNWTTKHTSKTSIDVTRPPRRLSSNYAETALHVNKPKGRRLLLDAAPNLVQHLYLDEDQRPDDDESYFGWRKGTWSGPVAEPHQALRGPASSSILQYQQHVLLPQISLEGGESKSSYRSSAAALRWEMTHRQQQRRKSDHIVTATPPEDEQTVARNRRHTEEIIDDHPVAYSGATRIMVDPYSSSAREFIASRQILFLTRRRLRISSTQPHVWIVNYYGRTAMRAISHSKIVPGASVVLTDTATLTPRHVSETKMTRLLGYMEVTDVAPHPGARTRLKFARLIGRGGTSAVYAGGMEGITSGWSSAAGATSPVVAKILNPKHWKCALAELVASAAALHRITEGINERHSRRKESSSPTTATSSASDDHSSPFIQGGIWLMPTELHLFWESEGPSTVSLPGFEPKFSNNELPALCCLVLRNSEDGVPLLTWLNTVYVKRRCRPSHEMCVYFAYTVITLIRQLHSCGLVHGDIKPDNFVLLPATSGFSAKKVFGTIQTSHPLWCAGSPPPVTIAGIDFGRSLDVYESLRDVTFIGDTQVSDFRCPAMLERSSWETQIDLTGLAVTIFTTISLKYPKIRKKRSEGYMTDESLSLGDARGRVKHSYWFGSRVRNDTRQNEFWLGILDRLINFDPFHTSDGHTLLDSCLLLRQLEKELLGLFGGGCCQDLQASYEVLFGELQEMHEFVVDYQKRGSTVTLA